MASQTENITPAISAEEVAVPVTLTIPYPERLSRLLIFFKWLFVIPLVLVACIWGIAVVLVTIIVFFAILFVGRFPRGLFNFVVGFYRFCYRVSAYFPYLLVDKWWPTEDHPLQFELEYPERLSRGIVLLKFLALITAVVESLATVAAYIVVIFAIPAWFIILFTGRYPRGMYNVALMLFQWQARVRSWQYLLRDEWSLFGTTRPVKIWVLVGVILFLLLFVFRYVAIILTSF